MSAISPELVLVDPELARRARAELPDLPASSNGFVSAAAARAIVGAGAVARTAPPAHLPLIHLRQAAVAEFESEAEPDRALRRRLVLAGTGLAIFVLGVVVPPFFAGGDPALRPATPPPAAQPPETTAIGPAAASPARPRPTTRQPVTTAIGRPAASPSPSRPAPSPHRSKRVNRRVPTRLFVWLPNRRASYYHVRFSQGRRTVFEAWPSDARVTVPLRGTFRGRGFAFSPGRYRWVVRPAYGLRSQARYGRPIVRSVWVVRN